MAKKIETDTLGFIKFWLVPLFLIAVIFLLYKALTGLIIVGVSIFLALALKPLVRKVDGFFTRHFGRSAKHQKASVVLAYLIVVLALGAVVAIVGPVVVNETARFATTFPTTFEETIGGWEGINNFGQSIGIENLQNEITNALSSLSENILGVLGNNLMSSISGIADALMKIVLTLVLTLLILLEGPEMMNEMWRNLEKRREDREPIELAKKITYRMGNVVSTYVSRQCIVALLDGMIVAAIVFVLSLVFGFSTSLALPMGMITMVFYLIPMFGQFIGGTLVTLILLVSNPIAALVFAIIYIIYAQIENNLIAPKIQGDALKLEPLVILVAITIGMYMFGLLGAIIAVPIAGCIRVLVDEYPNIRAVYN